MLQKNRYTIKDGICTFTISYKGDHYKFRIDRDDLGRVSAFRWHLSFSGHRKSASIRAYKGIKLHHFILGVSPVRGMVVDHIDGDIFNNTKKNLRLCKNSENMKNQKIQANNKSGYKGVSKKGKKWKASIVHDGKHEWLGCFDTPEEAAYVYDTASQKYHGGFGRGNGVKKSVVEGEECQA